MATDDRPLIVQSDHTVLLEVDSPRYVEARDALLGFAELVKSPEHVHTYRVTPLSIWNARAAGHTAASMTAALENHSRYPPPANVLREIREQAERYGKLRLLREDEGGLRLECEDLEIAEAVRRHPETAGLLHRNGDERAFEVRAADRGRVKQALIKAGFPAEDLAGYTPGEPLEVALRSTTASGDDFSLRDYQREAVDGFHVGGGEQGGNGVVVLPCGAGKTVVGMAAMTRVQASTLILTTSTTAARQWISELIDKTDLDPEQVGEYTGYAKDIRPVTVATYQILTHRGDRAGDFTHLELFDRRDWGLIVYDEVHLLPAPVFQVTATLQARRRLGLTATLVREDGREGDVFALIGPKRAEVPWKVLERSGWIATARCTEVRLPLAGSERQKYLAANKRSRFRVAAENPAKTHVVRELLDAHAGTPALVIGMYVDQLKSLAADLDAPLITGSTGHRKRDKLFAAFRSGELPVLVVSKVANFAVDLPDASLAIQVSGTFGSRQEEAQRLGRLLRPKGGDNQAHFYSLVTRDTPEQDFALNRQLFLCEQGYEYRIVDADDDEQSLVEAETPRGAAWEHGASADIIGRIGPAGISRVAGEPR